ncbi:hypothetical protein [Nonomuraea fuscirosea]|uniref:hypothetical protein n=1 Tax=Nonomuraea fuscirosea TaxID=1291556 RepID=UPI003F4D95A4
MIVDRVGPIDHGQPAARRTRLVTPTPTALSPGFFSGRVKVSADGGSEEFPELRPSRRASSATRPEPLILHPQPVVLGPQLTDNPRLLHNEGGKLVIRRTPIPGLHTKIIHGKPATYALRDLES